MWSEQSLKISALKFFWFAIYDILKIRRKMLTYWLTELMNEWINNEADCRTAPATPGQLNIFKKDDVIK